jgi:ribosome biogenesis GTPase
MLEFDYDALRAVGLTPALAAQAMTAAKGLERDAARGLFRVIEVHRETVLLHDGRATRAARVAPWLHRTLEAEGTALAAGDWTLVSVDHHDDAWVDARVPPVSHIARRDSDGRSHPIVSNVDVALIVMGLDDDFNPRRLERFIALVWDEAIVKVVVLTKADVMATREDVEAQAGLLRARVPAAVPILAVNALDSGAAQALEPYLAPGHTLVMLGSSGAGKSTLTNTLMGAPVQDTGPVRAHDGRGMHTTTSRSLHRLPGGALVIDTPGLRTLRPDADASALAASFADIEALAMQCRFGDCTHTAEPGCAVREGVDADRLRNYHKLQRELRRDSISALERRRQLAVWKARGKAAKVRMRQKRGEPGGLF